MTNNMASSETDLTRPLFVRVKASLHLQNIVIQYLKEFIFIIIRFKHDEKPTSMYLNYITIIINTQTYIYIYIYIIYIYIYKIDR